MHEDDLVGLAQHILQRKRDGVFRVERVVDGDGDCAWIVLHQEGNHETRVGTNLGCGNKTIQMYTVSFSDQSSARIKELLDTTYGCYLWPSSLVLACYLVDNPHIVANNTILELGCGVALPGLICCTLGAAQVHLSDSAMFPQVLANIQDIIALNASPATLVPLSWGKFPIENAAVFNRGYDLIIGADLFFEPSYFEDLIATVSYLLNHSPRQAKFLTAYQERSSKRNIQWLLDEWGLDARVIEYSYDTYHDRLCASMTVRTWPDEVDITEHYLSLDGLPSISLFEIFLKH